MSYRPAETKQCAAVVLATKYLKWMPGTVVGRVQHRGPGILELPLKKGVPEPAPGD